MRGFCIMDFRLLWANSSSLAIYCIHTANQCKVIARILRCGKWAHVRVSCGSQFCAGWANANSFPKYSGAGSGPMRGLCIRDLRLLWANSNSSVTSAHLIHVGQYGYISRQRSRCRPTRESRAAAHCMLDRPMRAHALIARILLCRKWAHARTLHKGFQTAVGQLELISNIRAFNPWANSVILPGSGPAAGPRKSLLRQPVACWMGQCELIAPYQTLEMAF